MRRGGSGEAGRWAFSGFVIALAHAVAGYAFLTRAEPPLPPEAPPPILLELSPMPAAAPAPAPPPPAPPPPAPPPPPPPPPPVEPPPPPPKRVEPPPRRKAEVALPKPPPPRPKPPRRREPPPREIPPEPYPEPPRPVVRTLPPADPAPVSTQPAPMAPAPTAPAAPAAPAGPPQSVASAAAIADAKATFAQRMAAHLSRHKRSVRVGWDRPRKGGIALVTVAMTRQGKLLSVRIQRSSGFEALDEEALALVRRAEPLPPLPPEMPGESVEFTMPLKLDS